MLPEEIKKLSREYADDMRPVKDFESPDDFSRCNDLDIHKEDFCNVVKWLSERFCIVEKSEILADYEFNAGCFAQFSASGDDRCNKIAQWHKGKCDELESLFGKDTFEEEGNEQTIRGV